MVEVAGIDVGKDGLEVWSGETFRQLDYRH